MSFLITTISSVTPFIAIMCMIMQRSHILMSLLSLEAMILTITFLITVFTSMMDSSELFFAMVLLTFGACEASLGLACLVCMVRFFGNDNISSSSLL